MKISISERVSGAIGIIATGVFYPVVAMAAAKTAAELNNPSRVIDLTGGSSTLRGSALTISGVVDLIKYVVGALSAVAYIAITAYILWAGLKMAMARDNTTEFAKGKTSLWHAVLAALVIFGVNLIIYSLQLIAVDPSGAIR